MATVTAVSSLPRDSTDGFRDPEIIVRDEIVVGIYPVGTALTWIRTLTSRNLTA